MAGSAASLGIEFTGLRELNAAIEKMGAPDGAINQAMTEAGTITTKEANNLMPKKSGKMAGTLKVTKSKNKLVIQVGNNTTVPYAMNFHAQALNTSRGGYTFHVPAHARGGYPVRAYSAARLIPNNPFMITAFIRTQEAVYTAYVNNITALMRTLSGGP
jgi:hypothetical protein